VDITIDPAKDEVNKAKHGISLADAAKLDWDTMLVDVDRRRTYSEVREVGLAPIGDRLYCVVFTMREGGHRIISLRKANQREFDYYDSKTNSSD
jgi:uncharacterized DUF497 family protein